MFTIQQVGSQANKARLLAPEGIKVSGARDEFREIASSLGVSPVKARKIGYVSARRAEKRETIETRWNGKETSVTADPGDWIVSNMNADKALLKDREGHYNVYAIAAAKFPQLYQRDRGATEQGDIYKALAIVEALPLPGGFEILAPWGETQVADAGYLLKNGSDVYGNNQETFEKTYVTVG